MARGQGGDSTPPIAWASGGEPKLIVEGTIKTMICGVVVTSGDGFPVSGQPLILTVNNKGRERAVTTDQDGRASFAYVLPPELMKSPDLHVEVAIVRTTGCMDMFTKTTVHNPQPTAAPQGASSTPIRATLSLVSTTAPTPPATATMFRVVVQVVDQNGKGVTAALLCRGVPNINGPTDDVGYAEFDIPAEKETPVSFAIKGTEVVTNSLTLAPTKPPTPTPIEPVPWTPAPATVGTKIWNRFNHGLSERWKRFWE